MECRRVFSAVITIILGTLLSGCATAPKVALTSVWKDQTYQGGHFQKILVVAAARKEATRIYAEDECVRQVRSRGIEAVASHTIIPFDKMLDKAVVSERIKGMRIDAVLASRVLYVLTDAPPLPKRPNWHEFYSDSFGYEHDVSAPKLSPGKMSARLETELSETSAEKTIWRASSDVAIKEDPKEEIRLFVTLLVQQLSRDKLIP